MSGPAFEQISTWADDFVSAIRRHYPGSRGAPVGKKMAWRILERGRTIGWIGVGEPSFKLNARRLLGMRDARYLPGTVNVFMYRLVLYRGPLVRLPRNMLHEVQRVVGGRKITMLEPK